jgi:hypothetical protein
VSFDLGAQSGEQSLQGLFASLSQQQVANELKEHQSFVAKYEGGERRLDVVEFVTIARALKADPLKMLANYLDQGDGAERTRKPGRTLKR